MANWFQRIIDTERWAAAFDCVTELYALQVTSSAFDGSAVMQSPTDRDYHWLVHHKSDGYKKTQENKIEEKNENNL